jgi:arylamine N-acetyltransferase
VTDAATIDQLLRHIGLRERPAPDGDGLRTVHRAFLTHIAYDGLTAQLGEHAPLAPDALIQRTLTTGRGGYCFEINTILLTLLEGLGFKVQRRQGIVGARSAFAEREPTNHLALVATTAEGDSYICDSSFVATLVVQQPADDHIVTLRARTLSRKGPGRDERTVLADQAALATTLRDVFAIDPEALGADRIARLWRQACVQHEAFVSST